jgi:hypothetical protein
MGDVDIVLLLFPPTFYVLVTSGITSAIMKLSLICATCIVILISISLRCVLSVHSRAMLGPKCVTTACVVKKIPLPQMILSDVIIFFILYFISCGDSCIYWQHLFQL